LGIANAAETLNSGSIALLRIALPVRTDHAGGTVAAGTGSSASVVRNSLEHH
jgi:hypothetical protein